MAARLSVGPGRILEGILGRRTLWRLGRHLYRYARRDGPNDPRLNGEYALQRKLVQFVNQQNKPLHVIDIGANVGDWSLNLLETCQCAGVKDLRLWAFEPSPAVHALLVDRMGSQPFGFRVTVHQEAVSDATGTAAFDGSTAIAGNKHLLTDAPEVGPRIPSILVPITTLTSIFVNDDIEHADIVKSDVEGFDLKVMRGTLPRLREGRIGLLQFEYNGRWIATRSHLRDVFEDIANTPYRVCKVVPGGLDAYPVWHPELETFLEANFALAREDLAGAFGVREGGFDDYNTYSTS